MRGPASSLLTLMFPDSLTTFGAFRSSAARPVVALVKPGPRPPENQKPRANHQDGRRPDASQVVPFAATLRTAISDSYRGVARACGAQAAGEQGC
jgi:hypothetical protein